MTVIDKYFEDIVNDQDFFSTPERLRNLLKMIPDETLRAQIQTNLGKSMAQSLEKWHSFVNLFESYCKDVSTN